MKPNDHPASGPSPARSGDSQSQCLCGKSLGHDGPCDNGGQE